MFAVRGGTSAAKPYGIALVDDMPAAVLHARTCSASPRFDARDEQFPHAARDVLPHRVAAAVPPVEVADDADALGIRRPDGEVHAGHAVDRAQLCAELLVALPVLPFAEQVQIEFAHHRRERVRVVHRVGLAGLVSHAELVGGGWGLGAVDCFVAIAPCSSTTASYKPAGWIRRIGRVTPWAGSTTQAR